MPRLLTEPLLHFLLLGAVLFALYAHFAPEDAQQDEQTIAVTNAVQESLRIRFQRTWGRPPSREELAAAVEGWVREEILYREGLALGLVQGDPVIRQRLGQKLMTLAEVSAPSAPSESALEAWYEARRDEYREPVRLSFTQRFFERSGDAAADRARVARALKGLNAGSDGADRGDGSLLPPALEQTSPRYIAGVFGEDFAERLQALPLGEWVGPVESSYGLHAVQLSARSGGGTLALAQVREQVVRDWAAAQKAAAREAFYEALRERYQVTGAEAGAS